MILEMTASAVLALSAIPTRGSSATAEFLATELEAKRRRLRSSYVLGSGMREAAEELRRLALECSSSNWDGYRAAPVTLNTISQSRLFVDSLPPGVPAPSVGAEPDGHVTFEWHRSPWRTLSVSVSPEGDLHYAALMGLARAYGTEPFLGELPKPLLDLIRRVNS